MPWLQITIKTRESESECVAEALHAAGAAAVTLQDAADQPLFQLEPGATPLWAETHVIGLFEEGTDAAAVLAQVQRAGGTANPPRSVIATLPDQDWERAWMDQFHPLSFGERLWVVPHWHTPPEPDAVNILLDPGLAFGTGTHPTTALCLEWLDGEDIQGQTVIDFGCGSGILAIAAAKLGAARVWAVDHDPQALQATRDNARANGVEGRITPCAAEDLPVMQADILLANILAAPIIALTPVFAGLLPPGGRLLLSGILDTQADEVLENYRAWFTMAPIAVREEWVRAHGQRNTTAVPGVATGK